MGRAASGLTPWTASVALVALVLAAYGPGLARYFTSEDFLLVRFLGEHPPWRDPDLWTGPWLGITAVKFYRPVSTLIYGLEIAAFGASPLGYNVVHTLVHALNAVLLFASARRLAPGRLVPFAAAALFALYPLHPNAVLFGASFATVYGATFVLAGLVAYQRFRETERRRWWAGALGCYVLALGSYEAATVFPAFLVAHEVLLPRRGEGPRWRRLADTLPFFVVLGAYVLVRRAIFGRFVGGYDEYSARLLGFDWRVWLTDLATSIEKLHVPTFDRWPGRPETLLFAGLVLVVPIVFLARRPARLRAWLFAWTWTVIGMTPFAFQPCVPGNGRYWYVPAAGVALSTVLAARGIAEVALPRWRVAPVAAVVVVGLAWGWLLAGYLRVYVEAGRTTRTIQAELIREHAAAGSPPRTFVTGYPYFLVTATLRTPVAQVFHYGLRDSVNPPFVPTAIAVLPLPPLPAAARRPIVAGDPTAVVLEWNPEAHRFRRLASPPGLASVPEIHVRAPRDGAVLDTKDLAVEFVPGEFGPWRLIVVSAGNATIAGPIAARGGATRQALPVEFVTTMARLYPGAEFLWWLEAPDASGQPVAWSRMRSFRVPPLQ
jgi:hypothetical protein